MVVVVGVMIGMAVESVVHSLKLTPWLPLLNPWLGVLASQLPLYFFYQTFYHTFMWKEPQKQSS